MGLQDKVLKLLRREISFSSLICFHEYPDVLTVADMADLGGMPIRILYCFECERPFYREWDKHKIAYSFRESLIKHGWEIYDSIDGLREYRDNLIREKLHERIGSV